MTTQFPKLPITECPSGAGSINDATNTNGGFSAYPPKATNPYVPPVLQVGQLELSQGECYNKEINWQETIASENLKMSGAPVNIFKLLGVHQQGTLIDITGSGFAIGSSGQPNFAFNSLSDSWISDEVGLAVTGKPAWIGYDFGPRKTSYGQPENAPSVGHYQHMTSFRITQPNAARRARQVRVERSNGGFKIDTTKVVFTGSGNGSLGNFRQGVESVPGVFTALAINATSFTIMFTSASGTKTLGVADTNTQFNSIVGSLTIYSGTVPFAPGDMFTAKVELDWYRVDVVNIPDVPTALINIKQSAAARYWRVVPLVFTGLMSNQPWEVEKLELFDVESTRLDNIQDTILMENRDRDYANSSIQIKVAYQPIEAVSDLSKFGFQVADMYTFTTTFADMVAKLGRPIVVGDVIEIPGEIQYDHNLRPVRKFLEVNDVGWAADGFTTAWKPILYKFSGQQLIPSQEHRDIFGTVDTQKYVVDDGSFFDGIEQIQTAPLTITEKNAVDSEKLVPETGTNVRESASGRNRFNNKDSYDGDGLYVQDGLPPNGLPYDEGFKLPDVAGLQDGAYFRLNYAPELNIPARLYKFSIRKNKWIYVETDRRATVSSHKPSQLQILNATEKFSLSDKP